MRYPPLSRSPGVPPLVAVAHGSRDPRAAATVEDLLGLVRERAAVRGYPGLEVRAAYLGHAAPALGQALGALDGPAVVLPLLLTAAYHSKADIPGVLREARTARPRLAVTYGRPLGPHPRLLDALDRRLAEVTGGEPTPGDTAVVLAAAGSSDPAANAVIAATAARWRSARGWQAVLPAYASAASPTPPQAVAAALRGGARRVLVASYLLAPGLFADQVRRDSLAAGAAAVSSALGAAPEVADVVLSRYAESLAEGRAAAAV
ncbi:MAG TPA: CbiX/SirB N-terminal domain-containing protein [Streptosporangiaceae bacterium]